LLIFIYSSKKLKRYNDRYIYKVNDKRKELISPQETSINGKEKSSKRYDFNP
jgi:hypothetical protein